MWSAMHPSAPAAGPADAAETEEIPQRTEQLVLSPLQRQSLDVRTAAASHDALSKRARDQAPVYEGGRQSEPDPLPPAGNAQASPHVPPESGQIHPGPDRVGSSAAVRVSIQPAAGGRLGPSDAILASHALPFLEPMEIGLGLGQDVVWYGVYLKGIDRVAERNTIYGRLADTRRFDPENINRSPASCCQGSATLPLPEQHGNATFARKVPPTFFVYGLLRKKNFDLDFKDGWKLQAGLRHMEYSSALRTRAAYFTVEYLRESLRTSYSYQLERSHGARAAPSHILQLDYLFSLRDTVGVSYGYGREVADFGPLGIQNSKVRNVTFRGQHWFKPDWALTYQAGMSDHGSMPGHKGIRFGLRHSF